MPDNNSDKVLIAGGSGLIGRHLAKALTNDGYKVRILTRNPGRQSPYPVFYWDIDKMQMDESALAGVDIVINLAGEPIADKRWTTTLKKKILDSRVHSTALLHDAISQRPTRPKAFIAASGIGFYGQNTKQTPYLESDPPGDDFLGKTCVAWENASHKMEALGIRTVILRTGVVLSREGGALPKMTMTRKLGFVNALGSGKQYFPWIHIDDMVGIYRFAIKNPIEGIFNAVAPALTTQNEFINMVAEHLKRTIRLPNVPAFLIKILMGEMAVLVLEGSPVSSEKIIKAGYEFKYPYLSSGLGSGS